MQRTGAGGAGQRKQLVYQALMRPTPEPNPLANLGVGEAAVAGVHPVESREKNKGEHQWFPLNCDNELRSTDSATAPMLLWQRRQGLLVLQP